MILKEEEVTEKEGDISVMLVYSEQRQQEYLRRRRSCSGGGHAGHREDWRGIKTEFAKAVHGRV